MRPSLPPFVLASLACLGACQVPPAPGPEPLTEALPAAGYQPGSINDVAVLPVAAAQGADAPVQALRRALQRKLVDRLYSPLSLEYVDGRWTEAGWSASPEASESLLRVEILRWDTGALRSHGAIRALVDARLYPAAGLDAAPLWGYRLERRVEVPRAVVDRGGQGGIEAEAAQRLAELILAELPERDPLAGGGAGPGDSGPAVD